MFKKWGFWRTKKKEEKEEVESTHESSFSDDDLSELESISEEADEPEEDSPIDILNDLAQLDGMSSIQEEEEEETDDDFASLIKDESSQNDFMIEGEEGDKSPSSPDVIYIEAELIIPLFPPGALIDSPGNLISSYKGKRNFVFSFHKSDLLYGLSVGKIECKIADIMNRISIDIFLPEKSIYQDKTIELPLFSFLPKIPPEWFALQDQDRSREDMVTEMEDLFEPLEIPKEEETEKEKQSPSSDSAGEGTVDISISGSSILSSLAAEGAEIEEEKEEQAPISDSEEEGAVDVSISDSSILPSLTAERAEIEEETVLGEEIERLPDKISEDKTQIHPALHSKKEDQLKKDIDREGLVPEKNKHPEITSFSRKEKKSEVLDDMGNTPLHQYRERQELSIPEGNQGKTTFSEQQEIISDAESEHLPDKISEDKTQIHPALHSKKEDQLKEDIDGEGLMPEKKKRPEITSFSQPEKPSIATRKQEKISADANNDIAMLRDMSHKLLGAENKTSSAIRQFPERKEEHKGKSVIWRHSQAPNGIDINTANLEELMLLSGVGGHVAGLIIKHREENGSFQRLQELLKISGLGNHTYKTMTCLSPKIELRTAELAVNDVLEITSEHVSLKKIVNRALDLFQLKAIFISGTDGLIFAKATKDKETATLAESLSAVAPQLYKRSKKTLKQGFLPEATMVVFYFGKDCVTFSGSDQVFVAYIHGTEYPSQKQLRQCRKLTSDLAWYCSYRAILG